MGEIITGKMNGLWASRLPFEYKEKFGEEPPACLMDLIKNSFKDICKVELAQYTERELVYPVLEDHDKCKELRILQQELLPIGEKITVYLTYIYNCGYFCVQKEDSCIDQIAEELQKDCKTKSTPDMEQLKTGQFCAGLFSADKCWTRAKIIDIKDSEPKIELLFVDYGDVERVLSKDIRWLSEKTAAAPAQCIKCSLHGIQPLETETRWSSASAEAFAKIVKDVPLIAVTRTHYDDTCDVDLCLVSDPAINISDKLIQQGVVRSLFPVESYLEESDEEEDEEELEEEEEEEEEDVEEEEEEDASCPDPITLPDEKTWDVHITFINDSTNSVMMRFVGESYSDQLDLFESLLEQEFKKQKSEPVTEGMICVAHDDELYHRVHVESIMNKKVVCFFLDHGDTNVLTMEQLRPLDAAINKKLPYQAVPVSLYGLEEVAENMTVLSKLCELALGKTCVAEPVNRNDSFSVILYDTTGDSDININEEILRVVGKEERDVTAAIGDLSLVDIAAKLSTETVMNQQKDSSEKDVSKEFGSDVSKGGSKTASPKQKVDRPVSATHGITSTAETVLASGKIDSVEKDTSQITNSCKSSLGAENHLENTSHSFTNNTEQLTAVDVESRRMEPVLSLSSTSKQKLLPSGSSSVKSLSSEDESRDLDVRTIWNPKEYAKRPLPPKVVIPDEGSYIDLHVIQADSPSNFVCIPYEQMDQLNQLFEDMLEYFTPPPQLIIKEDEITLNHLYAGNVSGVWHRVKVQQFVDRLLSVYLVDMGRYSVVSLEELQPLPWKFWKIPMQAFTARLGGIKPLGGSWSEGAKLKFTELALEKDLVGLVISNKIEDGAVSLRLVDTSQENLDICVDEILLTKQFAVIA
ncbi:hypothetical protein ACJMK2_002497 [Sinanodonta woodiana]|uniref:Tudor domain-containing protein n=1 Tax=Sinanodonta woodiana TaxID=1069815 RepID=A0ABD3XX88_SINWO